MRRMVRFAFIAITAVLVSESARTEAYDPWRDWQFDDRRAPYRHVPERVTPSMRYVPKPKVSLPQVVKPIVGGVVLDPMPMNVSIPGKVIVFFIALQQFAAYDNGKIIEHKGALLQGPISSGTREYATPITDPKSGPHTVGHREVDYESKTYPEPDGGAPMPHAQFFRNDGIAMHAGYIDKRSRARRLNHGLSHGCVRLMPAHAKILYDLNVKKDIKVIVVRNVDELLVRWELGYFAQPI